MDGSFYFSAKFPCFGNGKVVCNASISFLRSDCTPCQFPPSWLCHTFHEIVSLLIANWWHRPQPGGFFPVFAWDIWRCIGRLWDIWRCTGHRCKYKTNLCAGGGDRPAVGGDGEAPGVKGLPHRRLPGEHRAGQDMIVIIIIEQIRI